MGAQQGEKRDGSQRQHKTTSSGNLDTQMVRMSLRKCNAHQFYSDGGFVQGVGGAAGVQLIVCAEVESVIVRHMVGYWYIFEPHATSAFQMKVLGLETALEL